MEEKRVFAEGRRGFVYKDLIPEEAVGWPVWLGRGRGQEQRFVQCRGWSSGLGSGTQAPKVEAGQVSNPRSRTSTHLLITHVTEHPPHPSHQSMCWGRRRKMRPRVRGPLVPAGRQIIDKKIRHEQRWG